MPREKIGKSGFDFLLNHAFFGDCLLHLDIVEKPECQTMATDARRLFYAPEFVLSLPKSHLDGIMAHETAHIVCGHAGPAGVEQAKGFNPDIWTLACEYMANHFVIDICRMSLPEKHIYDRKYADGSWSTESIARDLAKHMQQIPIDMLLTQVSDDHSQWGKNKKNNAHPDQESDVDTDWKIWIPQALHEAKKRGKLPAELERMIEDICDPKLPWQAILAEFVTARSKDDYSWRRPNKRHIHRGIYAPSLYSETINIGYAMDTSGSMGVAELQSGLAELRGICSAFSSYQIHLFACDKKVHHYQVIGPGDEPDIAGLCKGGGGTDFRPVLNYISEHDIPIDCLVYFTDGEGTFPDEPPDYPVLWVISGKAEVPWGRRCEL